jgi:hypothetical protein
MPIQKIRIPKRKMMGQKQLLKGEDQLFSNMSDASHQFSKEVLASHHNQTLR